jgi:phosphinothricin acetyltransferase
MLIRHADPHADGAACAAIYAPAVNDGVASFEEQAPTPQEMTARIERFSAEHPWLVADDDGQVVGYAYATQHRARSAYRWAADTSVYISPDHHRRGIARSLYETLLPLLQEQGMYSACAGITLPNEASVGLHEQMGYQLVGYYREIGYKRGVWLTVGWWQARLRDPVPGQVPVEPGPPPRLPGPSGARSA